MTFERDLDQFYTNSDIALKCYDLLQGVLAQNNIKPTIWLEPSAGSGAFFSIVSGSKLGIDIDPKIDKVVKADFLEYSLKDEGYITIGNPPFGKNSSLAIKFFNKCSEVSKVVAFIVPKTFKKDSVQKKLNNHMHLAFEWDVPSNSFNIKKEIVDVPCVFQVWIKQDIVRQNTNKSSLAEDFIFTNRTTANIAFQRVGVRAGTIKGCAAFPEIADASHLFINTLQPDVVKILKVIDWSAIKFNTAGNPSISKRELISEYTRYKASLVGIIDDYLLFNFAGVISIVFLVNGNVFNIKVDEGNLVFHDAIFKIQVGNVDFNLVKAAYLDFKKTLNENISKKS